MGEGEKQKAEDLRLGSLALISSQEAASATGAIRRDAEKDAALARAIRLSDEEPGIVLFLRSFQVEDAGHSSEEVRKHIESESQTLFMYQQVSGGLAHPVPDVWPEKNIWSMEAAAIAAVQARLPTVLLDNVGLSDEKRSELDQAQPIVIPALGEWWPVFLRIAERARLVIVFLKSATVSLTREIEFVIENILYKENFSIVGIDKNKISKFFSSSNQIILVRINFIRLRL